MARKAANVIFIIIICYDNQSYIHHESISESSVSASEYINYSNILETSDICSKMFYTTLELQQHTNQHPRFRCQICPASFFIQRLLRKHVRDKHTLGVANKCSFCDKTFSTKSKRLYHQRRLCRDRPT